MRDNLTEATCRFSVGTVLLGKDSSFSVEGRYARGGKNVEVVMDPVHGRAPVTPNPNAGDLSGGINHDLETYLANSRARLEALKPHGLTEPINILAGVPVTANRTQDQGGMVSIPQARKQQPIR